jgi:hypothetical protein
MAGGFVMNRRSYDREAPALRLFFGFVAVIVALAFGPAALAANLETPDVKRLLRQG